MMGNRIGVLLTGLVLAACAQAGGSAQATFHDNNGEPVGGAELIASPHGTLIRLDLTGLAPGWKAIHIHQHGTCEDHHEGFQASGGHLDPDSKKHGLLNPAGPEAGDLPNFWVHQDGTARAEMFTSLASLDGSTGGRILGEGGAALVIHESPDDHRSQPIGGAGARIACGVVKKQ